MPNDIENLIGQLDEDVVPIMSYIPAHIRAARNSRVNPKVKKKEGVRESLFEADEDVIPEDAQEIDLASTTAGVTNLKPKSDIEKPREPADPYSETDKFLTPTAALTAPDCTPDAFKPVDPSQVPGMSQPATYTFKELKDAEPVSKAEGTLDTLLGKNDTEHKPTQAVQPVPNTGLPPITNESQALAALGIQAPSYSNLSEGAGDVASLSRDIPEHRNGDIRTVMSAFRRFAR